MNFLKHTYLFIWCICSFITIFSSSSLSKELPIFISLGKDCEAAGSIQKFNLRKQAYPFDWNVTESFTDTCFIIKNRFIDFLNPHFLTYDGKVVKNNKYNICFNHDFPANPHAPGHTVMAETSDLTYQFYSGEVASNYLDHLNTVTEKYGRRIDRLYKLLESNSKIVFIRTYATPAEARVFTQFIDTTYPLVDYTLLVVHCDPDLNYDWCIPHVKTHYRKKISEVHYQWMHLDEWGHLFTQLGFISERVSTPKNTQKAPATLSILPGS